jgi:hypothetical protein
MKKILNIDPICIGFIHNVEFLSFPQAKRVGNPSGEIPDKPE